MDEKELEFLLEEAKKIDKNLAVLFDEKMTFSRTPAQKKIRAVMPFYDENIGIRCIENISDRIRGRISRFRFAKWRHLPVHFDKKV